MAAQARGPATLIGFGAVLLWSMLAVLTAASGVVPPFQLLAMSFAVGSVASMALWPFRPGAIGALRQRPAAWLVGVGGLFGYHFLYFTALRNAPPVEAGLLNYLWPMLIVLFSALLPGEKLRWHHLAGAGVALVGAGIVVTGGSGLAIRAEYLPGYISAILAAVFWAGYSVLSRRLANVPTDAVTGFCLATALLSAVCHLGLETTVWPADTGQWLAIVGLGLGPVGLAFYAWDIGVKRGDIQVLGATAYAAPLLSTLLLIGFGYAAFTPQIALAGLLITAGAVLAARDLLFRRDPRAS
jgi:drug/metabolite transporter (DMT)-like permease